MRTGLDTKIRTLIGEQLYFDEITYEEVFEIYGIGKTQARRYMRSYRDRKGLPDKPPKHLHSCTTEREKRMGGDSLGGLVPDPSDPYQSIANAIVTVAANDYRYALAKNNKRLIEDLEKFFFSDYFKILTKVDPKALLRALKREIFQGVGVIYI